MNTQLYILLGGIKSKENIQYSHFKIENIDTKHIKITLKETNKLWKFSKNSNHFWSNIFGIFFTFSFCFKEQLSHAIHTASPQQQQLQFPPVP